jgi:hypothetical protein
MKLENLIMSFYVHTVNTEQNNMAKIIKWLITCAAKFTFMALCAVGLR